MKSVNQNRSPGSILADYFICPSCQMLARHHRKKGKEYKCPRCGAPGEGARLFFPIGVVNLVKLLEGFFPAGPEGKKEKRKKKMRLSREAELGVVIIFTTLVEVLLQGFLERFMGKLGIPEKIQIRLFKDNVSVTRRIQEMFLTITEVEWKEAVRMLKNGYGVKVLQILKVYNQACSARNSLLYGKTHQAVPKDLPLTCLNQVPSLLTLFVALHNEYIARLVF